MIYGERFAYGNSKGRLTAAALADPSPPAIKGRSIAHSRRKGALSPIEPAWRPTETGRVEGAMRASRRRAQGTRRQQRPAFRPGAPMALGIWGEKIYEDEQ